MARVAGAGQRPSADVDGLALAARQMTDAITRVESRLEQRGQELMELRAALQTMLDPLLDVAAAATVLAAAMRDTGGEEA